MRRAAFPDRWVPRHRKQSAVCSHRKRRTYSEGRGLDGSVLDLVGAGGVLVGAELMTGTFYLLAVGVAFAAGGLAAWFGAPLPVQLIVGGVFKRQAAPLPRTNGGNWSRCPPPSPSARPRPVRPGPRVEDDGSARVNYRGTQWDAELAAPGVACGDHVHRRDSRFDAGHYAHQAVNATRPRSGIRNAFLIRRRYRHDAVERFGHLHARALHRRGHRHGQGDTRGSAAARVGRRTAGPFLRGAGARPQFRDSVRRPRRLPARSARNSARRSEPDLHHARQHAAAGGRHPVFSGDGPEARVLRFVELRARRSPSSPRRRCAASSARWNSTRRSRSATTSTRRSWRRSTRPRAAGASRCCATRSRT